MNEVYFPALFPGFPLPEELVEALGRLAIVHAELDRETRTIRLDAQAEQYLAEKQLQALCRDIEKEYGLRELKLSVRYPASELPNMDFRDLAQVFIRAFSPSAAILAGAGYEVTDEAVVIRLKANGKDSILQNAKKAEQFLRDRFGVSKKSRSRRTAIWRAGRCLKRRRASAPRRLKTRLPSRPACRRAAQKPPAELPPHRQSRRARCSTAGRFRAGPCGWRS